MTEKTSEAGTDSAVQDQARAIASTLRDRGRLVLAILGATALLEKEPDSEVLQTQAARYWRAVTCSWNPDRHARVYLVELLSEPRAMSHTQLLKLPGFPEAARSAATTTLEVFRADVGDVTSTEVEDVWFGLWLVYPDQARKLTETDLSSALKAFRRPPDRGEREGTKWEVLAPICSKFGPAVSAESLKKDWGKWRKERGR